MKPLVETEWLLKNLNKVRIFDATWHLPGSGKNAQGEFNETHIPGAKFFDIDKNSDLNSKLPHMMPKANQWKNIISNYGVKNDDHVIIYDNSELYSSCRVWFSFIYFGHNPNLISVLNGGFKKWLKENKVVTSKTENFNKSDYLVEEKENLIIKKKDVDSNINTKKFFMLDARSRERFLGKVKEPREGLRFGSIPGSKNLPYKDCLNQYDNTFKSASELKKLFKSLDLSKNLVFTCGSGVTACVLGLANSLISDTNPIIYDGSWSEYGLLNYEDSNQN